MFNVLLQLLDDGRLTDGQGRTVDFRNTVVIMTSNIRSQEQLLEHFRPEFVNRIDEIVVFDAALAGADRRRSSSLQLQRLRERLAERGIELELTDGAKRADRRGRVGSRLRRPAAQARDPAARREPARARAARRTFRRGRHRAGVRRPRRDSIHDADGADATDEDKAAEAGVPAPQTTRPRTADVV